MQITGRRNFFSVIAAFLFNSRARGQGQVRAGARELARHALSGPQEGMEAILVEVTTRPGVPSTAHRHPGFVLGYVQEGELKFGIDGKAPEIVKTGNTFFEPLGALHTAGTSANPDASVRFLAFIVAPKGSPVTLPA